MHLSAHFCDSNFWLNTKAGALKRISEFRKWIDREVEDFVWVVIERKKVNRNAKPTHKPGWMLDTEYLPVALLGDRNRHLALALIDRKIAVFQA